MNIRSLLPEVKRPQSGLTFQITNRICYVLWVSPGYLKTVLLSLRLPSMTPLVLSTQIFFVALDRGKTSMSSNKSLSSVDHWMKCLVCISVQCTNKVSLDTRLLLNIKYAYHERNIKLSTFIFPICSLLNFHKFIEWSGEWNPLYYSGRYLFSPSLF